MAEPFGAPPAEHSPPMQALRELFDDGAEKVKVSFHHDTRIFAGQPV